MTPARRGIAIGLGVAVLVLVAMYLFAVSISADTARAGTTVQGVDISGMTPERAITTLDETVGKTAAKKLRVVALDQTFVLRPLEAGLGLDAEASVAPAFGRTWNPLNLIGSLLDGRAFPAVATVDAAALDAQLDIIAESVDVPATEPTLVVKRGEPVLTEGVPGRVLDHQATADAITAAFLEPRAPVPAVVVKAEPTVSAESAQQAVDLATTAVASPVTVQAGSVTASIPPAALDRALSFTVEGSEFVPLLDGAVLHESIAAELAPVETPGRDATFKIRNGKPKVVKSKVGSGVSDEELAAGVLDVLGSPPAERSVTVSVGVREPELSTEQAQQLGVIERMSSFTQPFPYAAYRVQNIGEAARRINGTLLMPGETFSLNDTMKERTEKNGYTVGFVVGEGGVFDEQLGGGVSTAATTTWTAAFYAGMERVQTQAHSIYISRYKPGLEATVAWGIFDMKFRNDTPNGVFITAGITNTSVTVSFWGTKQYSKIEAEFGERTSIRPYATIYDKSSTCLGQGGVDGFVITVDRVFYQDGVEVKREPITTSYKPAPEVICHKKPKKPGKGDPSPSPSASGQPGGDAPVDGDTFVNTDPSPSPSPTKPPKR